MRYKQVWLVVFAGDYLFDSIWDYFAVSDTANNCEETCAVRFVL